MTEALELEEIQGLILSGYGDRPSARYALFQVEDAVRARRWLASLVPALQFGEYRKSPRHQSPHLKSLCANVAFTYEGLRTLGLHTIALNGFNPSFQEGMGEANRARRLGDDGESAPSSWIWGAPGQALDGVLAVFAGDGDADPSDDVEIARFIAAQLTHENGVRSLLVLDTMPANRLLRKEHFGFRDGIANPRLAGLARPGATEIIENGEVVLGYKNGYARLPLSPEVPADAPAATLLPASLERETRRDFGRNGSYLVFRQLRQDVQRFWQYVHAAKEAVKEAPSGNAGDAWLASRMVGRWPNGTPLTRYPEHPGPESHDDDNRFTFSEHDDAFGTRCPLGSHVRRTNPRDTGLPVPCDPELSGDPNEPKARAHRLELSNLHRLMRRGRSYGTPLDPHYDPEALRTATDASERGLYFLCFNANLSRQFEFVQSNWALNPSFAGLSSDPDPLLCTGRAFPFPASDFSIQGIPTRRLHGVPRVVETRGGAYFFMPSRAALLYLSEL